MCSSSELADFDESMDEEILPFFLLFIEDGLSLVSSSSFQKYKTQFALNCLCHHSVD